ncbi:MAG: hypothetical protein WAV28_02030 [Sedimentisphaerales bacterium]
MNLIKNHVKLVKMSCEEESFVKASPAERVSFMWELTKELWSLRNRQDTERRLQRNVTNLVRQRD